MAEQDHILYGKRILIGITGSIAAYKSIFLTRLLITAGAEVQIVMTKDAHDFVTPLTLATLSKREVLSDFTEDEHTGVWNNHVDLGMWADLILIAPATANTLAKMVSGECDNLLMATLLSAKCPVMVAPAMDLDMFKHDSTTNNLDILRERGVEIIEPGSGELASGLSGKGRLEEPHLIVEHLEKWFLQSAPFFGKSALVTAGPTYEAIDAVRFIGNHSSGKMGFAIAARLSELGAKVTLVSGPSQLSTPHPSIKRVDVKSADDMLQACTQHVDASNILVMSAAVADYKPASVASNKMKKSTDDMQIKLVPTQDILKTLGASKKKGQIFVGFALETDNEIANAQGKLERKNLDFIVLNSLNDKGAGFGHDTNQITMIDRDNKMAKFELKTKTEVAADIVDKILELL